MLPKYAKQAMCQKMAPGENKAFRPFIAELAARIGNGTMAKCPVPGAIYSIRPLLPPAEGCREYRESRLRGMGPAPVNSDSLVIGV